MMSPVGLLPKGRSSHCQHSGGEAASGNIPRGNIGPCAGPCGLVSRGLTWQVLVPHAAYGRGCFHLGVVAGHAALPGRVFVAGVDGDDMCPGEYRGILGGKLLEVVLEGSQQLGSVPRVSCPPDAARLCPRERELERGRALGCLPAPCEHSRDPRPQLCLTHWLLPLLLLGRPCPGVPAPESG